MSADRLTRITVEEGKCGGQPCIRGHRIRVSDILELLTNGSSIDDILSDFPFLEREDIYAAMDHGYAAMESAAYQADMPDAQSLSAWIDYVFDRPIDPPDSYWYFRPDAPDRDDLPPHPEILIAEAFERSGTLFAKFSDDQLNQGLWYLGSEAGSAYMSTLLDLRVPLENRLRALRSFTPLFEKVLAVRCSPHLSHSDEKGAKALNSACFMWWDNLPFRFHERELQNAGFGDEIVHLLRRQLALPHDACRESALHGIGHMMEPYPQLASVIDEFLSSTDGLRPELIAYAQLARTGKIL